jgi:predicted MPP superfamily phosphohydrolase
MKIHLAFLVVAAFLIFLLDWFLARQWQRSKVGQTKAGERIRLFLFFVLPVITISGLLYSVIAVPIATDASVYRLSSYFILFATLVYVPKTVIAFFLCIDVLFDFFMRRKAQEKKHHYPKITRRKFLSQIGIIMATAPFISLLFGVLKGRYAFYTRHIKMSFPNLPSAFNGLKIVQISDLHLGSFGSNRAPLADAVALINEQKPDVILFTGDLVNNFAGELKGWEFYFLPLMAPMGKYSILGNHDYGNYSRWPSPEAKQQNFEGIVAGHQKLGFTLLRNQSVTLSRNGVTIGLAGVENWGLGHHPKKGDIVKATRGIEDQPFNILMSHDPDHWDLKVLPQNFYDLTLSGHTHGMQFGIEKGDFRWSPAKYVQKRWAGLYREGNKFLYVNRGLGYLGMPARVGMPPEITVIELYRGDLPSPV